MDFADMGHCGGEVGSPLRGVALRFRFVDRKSRMSCLYSAIRSKIVFECFRVVVVAGHIFIGKEASDGFYGRCEHATEFVR